MKPQNRVYLAAIRRAMQERLHYPTREERNHAFATLWHGWSKKCERLYGTAHNTKLYRWQRGYISADEAASFWYYICE